MEWKTLHPLCHKDRGSSSGFTRDSFYIYSVFLRDAFGKSSGTLEELPKKPRRHPEGIPKASRRNPESIYNESKRTRGYLKKSQRKLNFADALTGYYYFLNISNCASTLSAFCRNYWKALLPIPF